MKDTALLDAGAQAERTALAWQRTGLSALGVGALLVHAESGTDPIPGVLLMAAGVLTAAVLAPLRYRRVLYSLRSQRSPVAPRTTAALAMLVCVVVAVAAATVVLR